MLQDADLVSIQEVRTKVEKAFAAWEKFRGFTQEQVDAVIERMAEAALSQSERLAAMAVEETGYGNVKDKLAKNRLSADLLPRRLRGMKTIGIVRDIPDQRITEIATPVGVVAAILPTTNPTSTAIYKILIALKAGNAIVVSPHPRAKGCTCATAEVLYRAAVSAGAPEGIVQCLNNPTLEATNALMRHPRTSVILSTGGSGIVKAAYSSGKPAFGVGPGNVPVLLDTSADLKPAVVKIVSGKSFDYGTLCSSEQTLVAESSLREPLMAALKANGAFVCDNAQRKSLEKVLFQRGSAVNPELVGHSAAKVAEAAGFSVPEGTRILVAEIEGIGREHPLSAEKLSPVLALYFTTSFEAALDACEAVLRFNGLGHTCGIYTNDENRARQYALRMPAHRILVNTPTPQGSVGITTNVFPAMTLGCGAAAGNSTGDNITPLHLLNIKRLAWSVRDLEPAAVEAEMSGVPQRGQVVAAVEKYLSARGAAVELFPTAAVVDRFLAAKAATPEPPKPEAAPLVAISDFVCESDVRQAVKESKPIYISSKSIITPSARDLAAHQQYEVLVLAKR